ncbi:MAG: response regulator [bacterium]|nr:response regulator [bacterium]
MPVIDGLEATRRIRAFETEEGLRRIPIVAVTARVTAPNDSTVTDAGIDQVLHKPIRFDDLKTSLDQFFS